MKDEDKKRIPATERVLDHILSEMDAGRLGPGSRVVAARIASDLDLSAAPVREALSVLAGQGVLDLLPDRGAVMREMTPKAVRQFWELLAPIGAVGLRLAARAIVDGADTAEITRKFAEIRREVGLEDPVSFLLLLNDWHYAVNRLGGNDFVTEAPSRLGVAYWDRYLVGIIDVPGHVDGYLTNYRRMYEAVMAGDGNGAAAILHFHADWSISLIDEAVASRKPARKSRKRA